MFEGQEGEFVLLKPEEIVAGALVNAEPLTLVLGRASYEQRALVFMAGDKKLALLLEGREDQLHHVVECKSENDWASALVPGVEIEIDPASIRDIDGFYPPLGSVVREGKFLMVQSRFLGNRFDQNGGKMMLLDGLPECQPNERICFTKWQIVLGHETEKRVLHRVDVTPAG